MNDLAALRNALDKLVDMPSSRHEFLMRDLSKTIPNTIREIPKEVQTGCDYNCFAYAVALAGSELHTRIAIASANEGGGDRFFASSKFADHLVRHGALVEIAASAEGHIATYWMEPGGLPTHMGLVVDVADPIRMKSKWGSGRFWEHDLFEVPERYGNHVRYFEPITTEQAEKAFLNFCKADPEFEPFCARHGLQDPGAEH